MSKVSGKNLVAQANALIKARYKTTRNEELLLKSMMSLINPEDKEFLTFTATTKELASILQLHPATAVREFDKITTRLMSRVVKIEKDEENWEKFQWVSKASLNNGIVSLRFHDELKDYLLALRETGHFTQYRLEDVVWFRSAYSSRIYEMLIEANNKKQKNIKLSLIDFRYRMMGDKSKSYPLFKDFKKNVINVAQKELSQKDEGGCYRSKLNFEIVTHRTGRKITDLEFIIVQQETTKKVKVIDIDGNGEEPEAELQKKLLHYGVSKANASRFIEEKTEEHLLEKIAYLEVENKRKSIKNTGAWLTKAIKEGWQEKSVITTKVEKQKAEESRAKLLEERRVQAEERKRKSAEIQVKNEFLETLADEEKDDLLEQLKNDPENGHLVTKIDSGMARSMLHRYIENYEEKIASVMKASGA